MASVKDGVARFFRTKIANHRAENGDLKIRAVAKSTAFFSQSISRDDKTKRAVAGVDFHSAEKGSQSESGTGGALLANERAPIADKTEPVSSQSLFLFLSFSFGIFAFGSVSFSFRRRFVALNGAFVQFRCNETNSTPTIRRLMTRPINQRPKFTRQWPDVFISSFFLNILFLVFRQSALPRARNSTCFLGCLYRVFFFTEFYLVLLGFTGFHSVFPLHYRVLPSLAVFY